MNSYAGQSATKVKVSKQFHALAALTLMKKPRYIQNRNLGGSPVCTAKEKLNTMNLKLVKSFRTDFKICGFIHHSEKFHL